MKAVKFSLHVETDEKFGHQTMKFNVILYNQYRCCKVR